MTLVSTAGSVRQLTQAGAVLDFPLLKYQPIAFQQEQASPDTAAQCPHRGYLPQSWQLLLRQNFSPPSLGPGSPWIYEFRAIFLSLSFPEFQKKSGERHWQKKKE